MAFLGPCKLAVNAPASTILTMVLPQRGHTGDSHKIRDATVMKSLCGQVIHSSPVLDVRCG